MADEARIQFSKAIAMLIAHAWAYDDFKQALVDASPELPALLDLYKLKIPKVPGDKDINLVFVQNDERTRYVVIPEKPQITDEDYGLLVQMRQLESHCTSTRPSWLGDVLQEIAQTFGFKKD